jgi:Enolase, C-terminal TIM barrel domain
MTRTARNSNIHDISHVALCVLPVPDQLPQDDWDSYVAFTPKVGKDVQVVGDDLTVTNPIKIKEAVEKGACNALLLKVNQVSTAHFTMHTHTLTLYTHTVLLRKVSCSAVEQRTIAREPHHFCSSCCHIVRLHEPHAGLQCTFEQCCAVAVRTVVFSALAS